MVILYEILQSKYVSYHPFRNTFLESSYYRLSSLIDWRVNNLGETRQVPDQEIPMSSEGFRSVV